MDKKLLLKLMPLLVILTAFADINLDILQSIGLPENVIGWIRLLGLAAVAYMKPIPKFFSREGNPESDPIEDDGIGGGGIKNPPKP